MNYMRFPVLVPQSKSVFTFYSEMHKYEAKFSSL
jgi:hypothetical protein